MSGSTAGSADATSGRRGRPGPDAHSGDATTLAAQASPARLGLPARRPGTYGVLL
jgi:hypothetical protein